MADAKKVRYDDFGRPIVRDSKKWYEYEDEMTGAVIRVAKDGYGTPSTKTAPPERADHLKNHPKARSNGFDKNPQNQKLGTIARMANAERKRRSEAGTLWRDNQRECLRVLMAMPRGTMYALAVQWNQLDIASVAGHYGYTVTSKDLKQIKEEPEPTITQLVCIQMVLKAIGDAKFGKEILELLEGKSVNQSVVAKTKKESAREEEKDVEPTKEEQSDLDMLKKLIVGE
ncbi:MAG: hypothetical protein ACK5LJ_08170 [Paracoccus sp. (in: a-proteobacteria)]